MYILLFSIIVTIIIICIIITIYHLLFPLTVQFTTIETDCKYRRFGCCEDNITPKLDFMGSNCVK